MDIAKYSLVVFKSSSHNLNLVLKISMYLDTKILN